MKILQIVIKNTSTLDYTLPIIMKLTQDFNNSVIVFYNVLNKRQILRESGFYSNLFDEYGVSQKDLSDYLIFSTPQFKNFIRWIFWRSHSDKISFFENVTMRMNISPEKSKIWCYYQELKTINISTFKEILKTFLVVAERYVIEYFVRTKTILEEIDADVILYDNRSARKYPGSEHYYRHMDLKRRPVVLIPHGPHFRDPLREYCPFNYEGDELPEYCDYWMPLRFGTPWVYQPEKRSQFRIIGYPGFDDDWLNFSKNVDNNSVSARESVNCLFIIRKYLPPTAKRSAELDPYVLDHAEFNRILGSLVEAIDEHNCHLIIKPHPSNNYPLLENDLSKYDSLSWEISHEPMYALLSRIDFVVSLPSTISLLPAISGIPTIILNTKLQELVHQEWTLLAEIYGKLSWYLQDIGKLNSMVKKMLGELRTEKMTIKSKKDIQHLRYYYDNLSAERAVERLKQLLTAVE